MFHGKKYMYKYRGFCWCCPNTVGKTLFIVCCSIYTCVSLFKQWCVCREIVICVVYHVILSTQVTSSCSLYLQWTVLTSFTGIALWIFQQYILNHHHRALITTNPRTMTVRVYYKGTYCSDTSASTSYQGYPGQFYMTVHHALYSTPTLAGWSSPTLVHPPCTTALLFISSMTLARASLLTSASEWA